MQMRLVLLLIISVFASEEKENEILVKIEEDEYAKTNSPEYIGVSFYKRDSIGTDDAKEHYGVIWRKKFQKWEVRRSFREKKVYGGIFSNLEAARRKSDELVYEYEIRFGEKCKNKLNFLAFNDGDVIENTFLTHGVVWNRLYQKWQVQRTFEGKQVYGGYFLDLEKAKQRSDELVYENEAKIGKETKLRLNFPRRRELPKISYEKSSIKDVKHGVTFDCRRNKWLVVRRFDGKRAYGGYFFDLDAAKQRSDELVREYEMKTGKDTKLKLNFPRQISKNIDEEANGGNEPSQAQKRKRYEKYDKSEDL